MILKRNSLLSLALCMLVISCSKKDLQPTSGLNKSTDAMNIFGGKDASKDTYPFMINIVTGGVHKCGASLVAPSWILTAAHCVFDADHPKKPDISKIDFYIGSHKSDGSDGVKLNARAAYYYPGFIKTYLFDYYVPELERSYYIVDTDGQNDFALVQLEKPVTDVTPVNLPTKDLPFDVDYAFKTIGWGSTANNFYQLIQPAVLQEIDLVFTKSVNNSSDCKQDRLCAFDSSLKNIRAGDSGGPLLQINGNTVTLVGTTSRLSDDLKRSEFYKTFYASDWIQTVIDSETNNIDPSQICFSYVKKTEGLSINGYNELCKEFLSKQTIVIPDFYKGVQVKDISYSAFKFKNIFDVVIPSSVSTIGVFAFANNRLSSVDIPAAVTTVGRGAFYANQLYTVTMHEGIKTIESLAFAENKLFSVDIPDSVITIGRAAFQGNSSLKSVKLPKHLFGKIPADAFDSQVKIESK